MSSRSNQGRAVKRRPLHRPMAGNAYSWASPSAGRISIEPSRGESSMLMKSWRRKNLVDELDVKTDLSAEHRSLAVADHADRKLTLTQVQLAFSIRSAKLGRHELKVRLVMAPKFRLKSSTARPARFADPSSASERQIKGLARSTTAPDVATSAAAASREAIHVMVRSWL
jgi:hypothetical protein